MKIYNILAIGNSFSEDAAHFLHQMAQASGIQTKVVNIYIGGCPLERHWLNIENDEKAYEYQLNGKNTGRIVSVSEVLQEECWDFIVTQQASHDSGWMDTYEPFLGLITDYISKQVPSAELLLHQTWAYEIDSQHECFLRYHRNQEEMYEKLSRCYREKTKEYHIRLIPSGDVIQALRKESVFDVKNGGLSLCRDGYHMNELYGRYALACVWMRTLFGVNMRDSIFVPSVEWEPDKIADMDILRIIKSITDKIVLTN